jgi:hypothetical protein
MKIHNHKDDDVEFVDLYGRIKGDLISDLHEQARQDRTRDFPDLELVPRYEKVYHKEVLEPILSDEKVPDQ